MKLKGTKVLITGGTGFLGHHVARSLLNRKADVSLLIQPHEKTWRLENIGVTINIVKAKLANREETKAAVDKVQPEVMIHFAGRMERRRDVSILDDLVNHHITSTVNLILSADPEVTRLIINTGTSEEYGEQTDPFVEILPVDPVSPYSATKAASTAMAIYLSKTIDIPIVTMRPFIAYGPAQLHDTLIPFLIKGVLQKKAIDLTEGSQYRDFIYVDDLASCYMAAIEKAETFKKPEIFNVGTGQRTRVRDVIETIADILNGHEYLEIGARSMRPGEAPSMIADIKKAEKILDWKPAITLRDGLKKTINWWQAHEEFWQK